MTEAELERIRPKESRRVYDLVAKAGIDVSDWSNFKGGERRAASNPKYCYDWAFVEPGKVVLLNLWFDSMKVQGSTIIHNLSMRQFANSQKGKPYKGAVVRRSNSMDQAIQTAIRDRLPIRVIVCEGNRKNAEDPTVDTSKVEKRLLDTEIWAVESYDWKSGACKLVRSGKPLIYIDQFEAYKPLSVESKEKTTSATAYSRSPEVRKRALLRAAGRCEWCGERGFYTHDDRLYLETHHIEPLSEGGEDAELNVAALCANHHREAHFGNEREKMASELKAKVSAMYAEQSAARE